LGLLWRICGDGPENGPAPVHFGDRKFLVLFLIVPG